MQESGQDRPVSSARAQLVLAIATAVGMTFGVQGIASALPAIQFQLHLSDSQMGLLTAVYLLPGVVLAIPLGYIADVFGRRRVFVSMTLLYGAAGMAQAWVRDLDALLALRLVQGIGFASLMPLSVTLVGDAFRGVDQLRRQANRVVAIQIGEFLLPVLGAALAAWAWNAPLAAQGLVLPLALIGALLLDDRSVGTPSHGYAGALRDAIRRPGVPAVLTAGFVRFLCKFALISYLPIMLVHDRGASLTQAALAVSCVAGTAALTSQLLARALRSVSASRMLMGAVVLVGSALIGLSLAPSWQLSLPVAVAFGIGNGTIAVLQRSLVTEAAPASVRAGMIAVSAMTGNLGKIGAPLAMGVLVLVISVPWSFAAMGVIAWCLVPMLRSLNALDPLLCNPNRLTGAGPEPL